ncbi:hypothetical protein GGR52DRAFT_529297 [Hypoxylon sp. FL1284]|nr:hypothetical protein GGR52DRAFT_529297 [Hypoxylon sp. FL1284]
MGESNTNTVNWWAVAHVVTILGQFSVCLTGAVTFAIGQPRRWDNHTPSDDEFWDDVTTSSTLPWISSAVGAFTTVLSIIVFTILHKAYKASSAHMLDNQDSQKDVFRNAVIGVTVALSLVVMADIAIAVNTGLSGLTAICGAASTAR